MDLKDKIYTTGHYGLVGSAIVRQLVSKELDITNRVQVQNFFQQERPDAVILAAAFNLIKHDWYQ